ncbi:MAG: hypothetical protein JSS58_02750, partial [Proteobacteria bacterium]|nr:hypothetical protein [Pseudomonadota bacterium]
MNLIPTEQITEMLVAIARTRSLSEILDHLARALDAVSGVDGYWINLLDASGENLRCMKVRLMPEFHELEKSYTGQSVKLSDSQFISRTLSSRTLQRLTLDNANESEQHVLHYCKAQSLLGLPIHDPDMPEEAPIGVLVLMEKIGGRIDAAPPVVQRLMDVYYPGLTNWLKLHHLVELHREAHSEVTANRRWLNFIQELSDLTSVDKIYQLFSAELFHQLKFEIAVFVTMQDQRFTLDKIVGATPEMQKIA